MKIGKINILIVDDHRLLRSGLRQTLDKSPSLVVVGEASTGEEAVTKAKELRPDLIVMDIHLPNMSGIEATRQILHLVPSTKIVILSSDADQPLVDAALQAGARGYLLKGSDVDELIQAIEVVMGGKFHFSPEVSTGMVEAHQRLLIAKAEPSKPALSERDKQLLRFIVKGLRNKAIAVELKLSVNSVETYRARLMKKIGCPSPAELVRYAIREGIAIA